MHEPIPAINITPMIDVMLVLLVMLILTIPTMTHKVPIDLPAPDVYGAPAGLAHLREIDRNGALR